MSMTKEAGATSGPPMPRRSRSQRLRVVSWLAALALSGLLLPACGSSPGGTVISSTAASPASAATSHTLTRPSPSALTSVFGRPVVNPEVGVTASGVYVMWQVSPLGRAATRVVLARIDAGTGRIQARRQAGSGINQVLAAGGSLWASGLSAGKLTLLRLNPFTLALTGRWQLAASPVRAWGSHLAAAGGGLWMAAGDRLLRLSLPEARLTTSVTLAGAYSSELSANAAGTVLIVSEADSTGRGSVQRRDPRTGALLASHPIQGVAAPAVAGPLGPSVWVSEPTGMMGYVQRLSAVTLAADGSTCWEGRSTNTCVGGTNDISASLADGLLWITQIAGGKPDNYCADPSDGRRLASIDFPQPGQDQVLAIAPRQIFYSAPGRKAGQYLRREPIPAACRAGPR
jgi:hypothetical protein